MVIPIFEWRHWDTERLSDLLKVTQLITGEAEMQPRPQLSHLAREATGLSHQWSFLYSPKVYNYEILKLIRFYFSILRHQNLPL